MLERIPIRSFLLATGLMQLINVPVAATSPVVGECEALARRDFSTIQDAPSQVTSARLTEEVGGKRRLCRVEGYVAPNIGFTLVLPTDNWNRKFMEVGSGGAGGAKFEVLCTYPIRRGYACIASDMGHQSTTTDYKWAYHNLQAEIDWSFRATHVVALAGKAITEAYYGEKPNYSYFHGCSTGGRQGTIEAQRFPHDFDGIIAGAPPFGETSTLMHMLWSYRALVDKDRKPIFTEQDLQMLHTAALHACDKDDGLSDGVLADPRKCRFKPTSLLCKAGQKNGCLTDTQIEAIYQVYNGRTSSAGTKLSNGGFTYGSELHWLSNTEVGGPHAIEALKFIGFSPDPPPSWSAFESFDFEKDSRRLGMMESLYGNTNPDLREFKKAGGKMLVYHGWNDMEPSPLGSIDYYENVARTMGGERPTQDFFRLYLVPGMTHCTGGEGPFAIDYIAAIEKWVEEGEAPDRLIGAHVPKLSRGYAAFGISFPINEEDIRYTRPIYPYPLWTRFRGKGDPNDAKNFVPSRR